MTYPDIWSAYGGTYHRCNPPSDKVKLGIDPISCAFAVIMAHVLVTMREFKWLATASSILTDHDSFMEHVKPHHSAKEKTHTTCSSSWLASLQQLSASGVLETITSLNKRARLAFGRFFIVAKPGLLGLGRAIFDMSLFSRLCARPYPVNLPHLPELLWIIGGWRHKDGFAWAADYRHWFYQNGFRDIRTRAFFTLECAGHIFQAIVTTMGWNWSCYLNQCVTWGIVLGEFPATLKYMVDWESLKGDTPPAYVLLRDRSGRIIGIIICFYDNIYVFAEEEWLVNRLRKHVIARSTFCGAVFKCDYCEACNAHCPNNGDGTPPQACKACIAKGLDGKLTCDPTGKEVDFLGLKMIYVGGRWVWEHRDVSGWKEVIPAMSSRRDIAHVVGVMVWDATVNLETMQRIDPAMDVLRRITKGVFERKQWRETVSLTADEVCTLTLLMHAVLNRGVMGVNPSLRSDITGDSLLNHRHVVYVATDASNPLVSWLEITERTCASVGGFTRGKNYDWGPAVGPHIFYKELQAASWGIQEMCFRYKGVTIVIATDNSAVFYLLRRGFSGATLAVPHMEMIKEHLLAAGNTLLPLLIPGIQNVADSPTRKQELCEQRLAATWSHMRTAVSGGSRQIASWSAKRPRDAAERVLIEEAPEEILLEQEAFETRNDDS